MGVRRWVLPGVGFRIRHEGALCCPAVGWLQGASRVGRAPQGPHPQGPEGHHHREARKKRGAGQDWVGAWGGRGGDHQAVLDRS